MSRWSVVLLLLTCPQQVVVRVGRMEFGERRDRGTNGLQ